MAMSLRAGGSGFSNLLATDSAALRQQKLIIDPPEPQAGSASVLYDAKLVTLRGASPGPGYENQSFGGLVEVRNATGTVLQNLAEFLTKVPVVGNSVKPVVQWLILPDSQYFFHNLVILVSF
jgi:hypothetical protein